jgi:tryptophan synthase alpha chain
VTEISDTLNDLKKKNQGALIAYVTVGDPSVAKSPRLVGSLVEGGVDIVELGIPFSDPIADGPTIQNAVSRSLAHGCRPLDVITIAQKIREKYQVPLVAMTYYNPIYHVGVKKFLQLARNAEISGLVVPDLPVEESHVYKEACLEKNLDTIFLASPSTDDNRLKQIVTQTSGYLYLISLYGVTGARSTITGDVLDLVKRYRMKLTGSLPFAVGFGIARPEHVSQIIRAGADGVIVGSAFVNIIGAGGSNLPQTTRRLSRLAHVLKRATKHTK